MSKIIKFICAVFFVAAGPQILSAQTTFNFPIPVGANPVGFAVVNPAASTAAATFRLYGFNGENLGTSTKTVPARGQLALLDSEIFPVIRHESELGWVQLESDNGTQAFAIGGDFVGQVDGGSPTTAGPQQVLPLIAGQMTLYGVNPGTATVGVRVQFVDANGNDVGISGGVIVEVPPKGMITQEIDTTSGLGALLTSALYIRLTSVSGGSFLAGEIVGGFLVNPDRDFAILTGIDSTSQTTQLNFPHAVSGQVGSSTYVTAIGVTNLSTSIQNDVTITFTPLSGSPIPIQRTLRAGGALRETIQQLFGLPSSYQDGWVQVQGTAPLTGFVAYAETAAGGVAVSGPQATGATALLFDHIADLEPWWTGIALVNPGNTDANVEIYAMNPDGSLIGGAANVSTARFVLPARTKTARLLSEMIPATQARTSDGGFVFVRTTNAVPIFGGELFFLRSGAAFANVAAAPLAPGITYTPPQP